MNTQKALIVTRKKISFWKRMQTTPLTDRNLAVLSRQELNLEDLRDGRRPPIDETPTHKRTGETTDAFATAMHLEFRDWPMLDGDPTLYGQWCWGKSPEDDFVGLYPMTPAFEYLDALRLDAGDSFAAEVWQTHSALERESGADYDPL